MKNAPLLPVNLYVPRTVREVLDELSKCQEDEYLYMGDDGNLISTYGRVVNIGHYRLTAA